KNDCAGVKRLQAQVNATSTAAVSGAVAAVAAKCVGRAAAPQPGEPLQDPSHPPAAGDHLPAVSQPFCDTMNVDDMMTQAVNQYAAGFFRAALSLVVKALACRQDVRMYRSAATYACAAHDAVSAKQFFSKLPAQFQPAIIQRCQQEGISLQAP